MIFQPAWSNRSRTPVGLELGSSFLHLFFFYLAWDEDVFRVTNAVPSRELNLIYPLLMRLPEDGKSCDFQSFSTCVELGSARLRLRRTTWKVEFIISRNVITIKYTRIMAGLLAKQKIGAFFGNVKL